MGGIRKKLRSEKGASISYALILFLVCAAAGSVVLAAATAAAGRLGGLAEADQRYYSVTSAAELLRDKYDGERVRAVKTERKEVVTSYSFDGSETGTDETAGDTEWTIDGQPVGEDYTPKSLFTAAANYLISADALTVFPVHRDFTLEAQGIDPGKAAGLTVNGRAKLMKDGTVTMELSSSPDAGSSRADAYTLLMTFSADRRETTSTKSEVGTPETDGENGYRVRTVVTGTTAMDITWRLEEIRTLSGGRTGS